MSIHSTDKDDHSPPKDHLEDVEKPAQSATYDDVFGEISEQGPNYRNVSVFGGYFVIRVNVVLNIVQVGVYGTIALLMKTQVGLGVLSIPSAFDTLGMVPGVICLLAVAAITTWSAFEIGKFKLRHRDVYGIDDVGSLFFGSIGKNFFGFIFCLCSGMLSISISLNALSTHSICTAIFVAIAAVIGFLLGSIQTLSQITWMAWGGVSCIVTSFIIVIIAVGVQDRPVDAPKDIVPWVSDFKIVGNPDFASAISAVSTIVFAYAGTPAFFSIVSEMREPQKFPRALITCQTGVTSIYIVVCCVLYYYCGSYVASPALGSAGVTMKKVCYGFAFPGLIVSTSLVVHYPAKYMLLWILRGSRHLTNNSFIHWTSWLGCTGSITVIAYIIASAIPVFDDLVSLVGALLGTLLSFQPMGGMWLYDHWHEGRAEKKPRWIMMVCWAIFVILIGTFLMVGGTYGSILSIIESYTKSGGSSAWSCADNSNST